jgi:hypothetical protein
MARIWVALVLSVLTAAPARAEMKIVNIQAASGPFWPALEHLVYFQGEDVAFRYQIQGMSVDGQSYTDIEIALSLKDATGKTVGEETRTLKYLAALGGDTIPALSRISLKRLGPGAYDIRVAIKDRRSSETASFERKVTVRPLEWAIATAAFFHDPGWRYPATLNGSVGEQLYFAAKLIGYDAAGVDIEIKVEVLDGTDKNILAGPSVSQLKITNPEQLKGSDFLTVSNALPTFTRVGDFTLRITAIDKIKQQSAHYEAPLHIGVPE